jgi:hypothetical protein
MSIYFLKREHDSHAYLNAIFDWFDKRVNWIYAIVTFTTWRNAIIKTKLGDMPLQLFYTSIYAIMVNTKPYTANYTQIHTPYSCMDT